MSERRVGGMVRKQTLGSWGETCSPTSWRETAHRSGGSCEESERSLLFKRICSYIFKSVKLIEKLIEKIAHHPKNSRIIPMFPGCIKNLPMPFSTRAKCHLGEWKRKLSPQKIWKDGRHDWCHKRTTLLWWSSNMPHRPIRNLNSVLSTLAWCDKVRHSNLWIPLLL